MVKVDLEPQPTQTYQVYIFYTGGGGGMLALVIVTGQVMYYWVMHLLLNAPCNIKAKSWNRRKQREFYCNANKPHRYSVRSDEWNSRTGRTKNNLAGWLMTAQMVLNGTPGLCVCRNADRNTRISHRQRTTAMEWGSMREKEGEIWVSGVCINYNPDWNDIEESHYA